MQINEDYLDEEMDSLAAKIKEANKRIADNLYSELYYYRVKNDAELIICCISQLLILQQLKGHLQDEQ